MAELRLNIRTDGAAFADPETGETTADSVREQLARILSVWAEKIDGGADLDHARTILDENGNDVGRVKLYEDGDE